ncbi:hypothetical protein [Streptomyces sp. NPDC002133]|uniref:hypothetical protein n=1 Tax=Streptomyces sp. NPDC002133 TaxID=3154409 RepID=UPI003321A5E4
MVEASAVEIPGRPRGHFALATAVRGEDRSPRSLAERPGVDRTGMTHLLDDLGRVGPLERSADRRIA